MQPLRDDFSWFQSNSLDVLLFLGGAGLTVVVVVGAVFVFLGKKVIQWLQRNSTLSHAKTA